MLAIVVAAVVAGGTAGTAEAAQPCWKKLVNDWYYDGRIDGTYPVKCYQAAIDNLPEDVKTYSSIREDMQRAILGAIRGGAGPNTPIPPEPRAPRGDGGRQESPLLNRDEGDDALLGEASGGFLDDFFDSIGPNSADAIPLPILILAGIAFLLLAAAFASAVTRRVHERRVTVANGPPERR